MPHATCHHCEVEISDHTSMVERRGELYCCENCARAMLGGVEGNGDRCAHCGTLIVDKRTAMFRGSLRFCCNNCAEAVPVEAGR